MLFLFLSIHLGKHDTDCASADPMKHASTMVAKILIWLLIIVETAQELLRRSGPPRGRRSTKHRRHRHTLAIITFDNVKMAVHYLAFCAVGVTVLKELNAIIKEPYMVCYITIDTCSRHWFVVSRMSRSTYPRHKRTVVANSCLGIQKLRLLPVCEFFHDVLCRCLWRAACM